MPLRVNINKDVIIVHVQDAVFRCRQISKRALFKLYGKYGERIEQPPDELNPKARSSIVVKDPHSLAYDLAEAIVIGWDNLEDENGKSLRFDDKLIADLDPATVGEIFSQYMAKKFPEMQIGQMEEPGSDADSKNLKPTSSS